MTERHLPQTQLQVNSLDTKVVKGVWEASLASSEVWGPSASRAHMFIFALRRAYTAGLHISVECKLSLPTTKQK
jgi:hypothetical protein